MRPFCLIALDAGYLPGFLRNQRQDVKFRCAKELAFPRRVRADLSHQGVEHASFLILKTIRGLQVSSTRVALHCTALRCTLSTSKQEDLSGL
jgi:hypothetical protein